VLTVDTFKVWDRRLNRRGLELSRPNPCKVRHGLTSSAKIHGTRDILRAVPLLSTHRSRQTSGHGHPESRPGMAPTGQPRLAHPAWRRASQGHGQPFVGPGTWVGSSRCGPGRQRERGTRMDMGSTRCIFSSKARSLRASEVTETVGQVKGSLNLGSSSVARDCQPHCGSRTGSWVDARRSGQGGAGIAFGRDTPSSHASFLVSSSECTSEAVSGPNG
jgi:hypothetical protein